MKNRFVGTLLAVFLVASLIPTAFADEYDLFTDGAAPAVAATVVEGAGNSAGSDDPAGSAEPSVPAETAEPAEPAESQDPSVSDGPADNEGSEASVEPEVPGEPAPVSSRLYVNGVPVPAEGYQNIQGTNYITIWAMMAIVDPEAEVQEGNGTVTVSSAALSQMVDGEGNTANAIVDTLSFKAGAGISYVEANGRCLYVAAGNKLVNGCVAVPVRVMAQVFNMSVRVDGSTGVAYLDHQAGCAPYLQSGDTYYNSDSLYWLSRVINAESGNQPLNGKIAVGNVIMNRVNDTSGSWPNTIKDVIFQKNQFTPAASGSVYKTPNAQSVIAAKLVLEGVQILPTAKFFNATYLKNTWAARNRPYICTIGGHAFYA